MICGADPARISLLLQSALAELWEPYRWCTVSILEVPTTDIRSVVRVARSQRLRSAASLLESFQAANIDPFLPIEYAYDTSRNLITGPIAELHSEYALLVDGLHRCLAAHRAGILRVKLMVVMSDHSLPPPPGEVCGFSDIRTTDQSRGPDMYRGLASDLFRPIGNSKLIDSVMSNRWKDRSPW